MIIFIMIALFGALSFAMTQSFRGGGASISKDRARIAASNLIQNANVYKQGVKTLIIGGCAETNISFQNTVVTGYTNTNSPPTSCYMFNSAGASLTWPTLDYPKEPGKNLVAGFASKPAISGGPGKPLIFYVTGIHDDVCKAVNDLLLIKPAGNLPVDASSAITLANFTGVYDGTGNGPNNEDTSIDKKTIACVRLTAIGYNLFYAVLHGGA